ncbi:GDSL-type esterase/lipase family protein [Actinokineospora sp. UTMC 2448]|uniref:GDSL-type esterase/lipase family protein n=1 Tax=Actinokineospora sp. UTMC 2448 TaxID=2268449 RepID=UPI0021646681|nr:GDSL-type esterase/lipase family protein [Actinokineospora sp. UTMC 2448]UVS79336.1 Lipase 2 precursor [Actinokineospora sp. UTMC 2448]
MNRKIVWPAALLSVAALVGGLFILGDPEPPPAPAPPAGVPRVLVAMGDSTMAGEAAGDYLPGTDGRGGNWCHRSEHAGIHATGLRGIDETVNLACSGAGSAQVGLGDAQQYGEPSQARRLGVLARERRVVAVVVAVGANDDPRFSNVLDACVQAWLDPNRPSCADEMGQEWPRRVEAMVPKVTAALADIRHVMAQAGYAPTDYTLVLQSYAAPVGPDMLEELRNLNGCPLRRDDLVWVRERAVPEITDGIRRAARAAEARFLDLSRAGVGREACSHRDPAQEWFSRLSVRWDDLRDEARAGHAMQESFHPNAAGHTQFGRCLGEFLGTDHTAAACLAGADGDLHPAPAIGP